MTASGVTVRIIEIDRSYREHDHGVYPLAEAIERSKTLAWAVVLRQVKGAQ